MSHRKLWVFGEKKGESCSLGNIMLELFCADNYGSRVFKRSGDWTNGSTTTTKMHFAVFRLKTSHSPLAATDSVQLDMAIVVDRWHLDLI